ncbi:hypothetical protein ACINWCA157_0016 [Acinetobacter radioresistens WC-A-157]|jgi:hypothetical protein|nr:hypothetical protein ACINWCA157_0016 [Acinetobacter radioresistens WC-A-157]EXC32422.1 hypothetical protein J520_1622 [Acinetobacter sp. 869535]
MIIHAITLSSLFYSIFIIAEIVGLDIQMMRKHKISVMLNATSPGVNVYEFLHHLWA